MGLIAAQVRRGGLDDRFMLFVVGTMAASVALASGAAALVAVATGRPEGAGVFLPGIVGGGMVFGPMLVVCLLPSALVFGAVWRLTGGESALPRSAIRAGIATAFVAAAFWTGLLWWLNGDGAEIVMGAVGIAAVLVSPFVAGWAYRRTPGASQDVKIIE